MLYDDGLLQALVSFSRSEVAPVRHDNDVTHSLTLHCCIICMCPVLLFYTWLLPPTYITKL